MKLKLQEANVLITGASSGIGTELARQIAPLCAGLILVARRADRLERLAQEIEAAHPGLKVAAIPCDVSRREEVDALLDQARAAVGEIDVLVNNAGVGDIGLFGSADWDRLARMMELNMTGLTYLTHRLVPGMVERRRGGILMVGSMASYQTLPGFGVYSATKYYVRGLAETLRAELSHWGIAVTLLCPGPVATEFAATALNGTKLSLPGFLELSAKACARDAIRGFARGQAVVLPGWVAKFQFLAHKLLPTPLVRVVLARLARKIPLAAHA